MHGVKLPQFFKALYFQDMVEIRTLQSLDFACSHSYWLDLSSKNSQAAQPPSFYSYICEIAIFSELFHIRVYFLDNYSPLESFADCWDKLWHSRFKLASVRLSHSNNLLVIYLLEEGLSIILKNYSLSAFLPQQSSSKNIPHIILGISTFWMGNMPQAPC